MANSLVKSGASSWLGGMSEGAAKKLEGRQAQLERQERKAMGEETEEDRKIEAQEKAIKDKLNKVKLKG